MDDINSVKIIVNNLGYDLIDLIYTKAHTKLTIQDKKGYYYYIAFTQIKGNSCGFRRFGNSNPYTIQNIKLWCKLENKNFELISDEYKSGNKKLNWKCLKKDCGEIFESTWSDIISNRGCPFCHGKQVGKSNCLANRNPELVNQWNYSKNGSLTPYNVSYCSGKKVWWVCENGHEWEIGIHTRIKGNNCPYCSNQKVNITNCLATINPELATEWHTIKNENLTPYDVTYGSGKRVWWKCKKCGNEWIQGIHTRNNGVGCPVCTESYGEKRISNYLEKNNFKKINDKIFKNSFTFSNKVFIPQKTFDNLIGKGGGLLSYDFYLPNQNLLIEFQGKQHKEYVEGFHKSKNDFEKQVEHDKRKKEYAKDHNINLLEIWYWDFKNIESILNKELEIAQGVA